MKSRHNPSAQHPGDKMLRSNATSLPFWRQLRWTLIFYFVLLTILPVFSVTYVILLRTSAQATNQVYDQLDSVAEMKNAQILRWLGEGKLILNTLVAGPNQDRFTAFITAKTPTPQEQADLTNMLIDAVSTRYFNKLFVYNTRGRVLASSDPADIGTMVDDQPYFEVSVYADYTQPPVADPMTGQMVMYMTRPLRIGKSDAVGVLAGRLDIDTLAKIMTERTGLGESGETYLVSLENRHLWTPSRFAGYEMARAYHSWGIDQALDGKKGRGAYDNYRTPAVPVFGSYRFVPELRAALLAEVEQSQAMVAFKQAQFVGIGVAAAAMLAAIVLGLLVAQQISRPVTALTETATRITSGDLSTRSTVKGQNEVGVLAAAFNAMADQLQDMIGGLEQRVAERTADLERRSAYMRASAEVGRAAASILDMDELTRQVVELIREHFGLYYVGLFLVDSRQEWAVLQAGTGEAGRALLARGHRLPIDESSMIGWCIANARPRVALEVGEDAVRLATAELPDTRSEAALPLLSRGRVLGALTVQSDQPGVFDQAALAVLQLMADQVAVALDNAQLYAESQAALESTRRAYGELTLKAWADLLRARPDLGYRGDKRGIAPAQDAWAPEMQQALRVGRTVQTASNGQDEETAIKTHVAIPIKVRGQAIAVLDTQRPEGLDPEEIALLEALAEQLGQALESARLYQDSQRRAAREQLASQITSRMRESLDIDRILQTAVREFGETLGVAEAKIQLVPSDRRTHG